MSGMVLLEIRRIMTIPLVHRVLYSKYRPSTTSFQKASPTRQELVHRVLMIQYIGIIMFGVTQTNGNNNLINPNERAARVGRNRNPQFAVASRASNTPTDNC